MELRRFGIRHHGPGSARSVQRALSAFAPEVILLEAPKEAEAVLELVGDVSMRPPVALLGYVPERPERAVFFPFAGFSPEWVTIEYALAHGVTLRCFDLPLANQLAVVEPERRIGRDPIAQLAAAGGYDDAERWWEDVVEHHTNDEVFTAIIDAMAAVRGDEPAVGEELRREATMRQAIRAARSEGFQRVAVVCGAWHTPALGLDVVDRPGAERDDRAALHGLAKTKAAVTWVPWTNRRLTSASGYGAGITSPGWYAHVFAHPGPSGVTTWFARTAELLRREDHGVSPDHLVAATRLAGALAVLRGRPVPGLREVNDAARAVLGNGGSGPLALIEDRLVVGGDLGSVPASTPMVPLARALLAEQKKVRLKPEGTARTLELDVRSAAGLARSRLLHRLWALEIPWGTPEVSRNSTGTFRETWTLRWEPELSVRLVDASAYGTTVATAATARLLERAARETALGELTALVELALLADLPEVVGPVMDRLSQLAAGDTDVSHLLDALGPLARAVRYGDVRSTDTDAVREVIDGLAVRVCAGIVPAFSSLDDDAASAAAVRLATAQACFALIEHPVRRDLWPRVLQQLVGVSTTHGMVRGRATRLLADAQWWSTEEAGARLSRALSPGTSPTVGAAFVEGLLAGSGTALLHDAALLGTLDRWLTTLTETAFGDVVPLLRRTFGAFEASERRRIGELVAGRGDGRAPAPYGWDLDPDRVDATVATVRQLLGVR